jgi:hypothetical protein
MLEKVGLFERPQRWPSVNVPWISEILVRLSESWKSMPSLFRSAFVVAFHAILVVVSSMLAFWLRFDGDIKREDLILAAQMLPWLVGIRVLLFIPFRLHEDYGGMLVSGISETLSVVWP